MYDALKPAKNVISLKQGEARTQCDAIFCFAFCRCLALLQLFLWLIGRDCWVYCRDSGLRRGAWGSQESKKCSFRTKVFHRWMNEVSCAESLNSTLLIVFRHCTLFFYYLAGCLQLLLFTLLFFQRHWCTFFWQAWKTSTKVTASTSLYFILFLLFSCHSLVTWGRSIDPFIPTCVQVVLCILCTIDTCVCACCPCVRVCVRACARACVRVNLRAHPPIFSFPVFWTKRYLFSVFPPPPPSAVQLTNDIIPRSCTPAVTPGHTRFLFFSFLSVNGWSLFIAAEPRHRLKWSLCFDLTTNTSKPHADL